MDSPNTGLPTDLGRALPSLIPEGRLKFLDGLRGLAALSVALMHCCYAIRGPRFAKPADLTALFRPVVDAGSLGVEMFFVLSGFVIAHSIRKSRVTPRFFGLFALRRSIRLDPPYWAAMVLLAVLKLASNLVIRDRVDQITWSARTVVANLTYTQYLLGLPPILGISWTLCLEVQFYIVFVLLAGLTQRVAADACTERRRDRVWTAAFGPLIALSFASGMFDWGRFNTALFLPLWYMFFTGVMMHRALDRPQYTKAAIGFLALVCVFAMTQTDPRRPVAAALSGAVILVAGLKGGLATWLDAWPIQYFGRISYSFYLVHAFLQPQILNLLSRYLPQAVWSTALNFSAAMLTSVVAADVLYRIVERPTVALARRIREAPQSTSTDPAGAV